MELEMPQDYPDGLNETFESLIVMRKKIYALIVYHLTAGECSYLSGDLYGYPYDYELYSKDSLDPNVTILNSLLEKVELTFEELKTDV